MSRYVCHFLVELSPDNVRQPLRKLLETCRLEPIHETEDYVMAREIPGKVAFAKLVRAEILLDVTNATADSVKLSFVLKNEELPLNSNNHCRQVFDLLRQAIDLHFDWQPLSSLDATPTLELLHQPDTSRPLPAATQLEIQRQLSASAN